MLCALPWVCRLECLLRRDKIGPSQTNSIFCAAARGREVACVAQRATYSIHLEFRQVRQPMRSLRRHRAAVRHRQYRKRGTWRPIVVHRLL